MATELVLLGTAGAPLPVAGRAGISSALIVDERVFIIDCGRGSPSGFAGAGLSFSRLEAVFLTHLHADHIGDLAGMLLYGWGVRVGAHGPLAPIRVYGPPRPDMMPAGDAVFHRETTIHPELPAPGTTDLVESILAGYAYHLNVMPLDARMPDAGALVRGIDIPVPARTGGTTQVPVAVFDDGVVRVTAVAVTHGRAIPALGYRFDTADGSVVFSGDTTVNDDLIALAQGADILVHQVADLGYLKRHGFTDAALERMAALHTDVTEVGGVAERAGVRELILSHYLPAEPGVLTDAEWAERARQGFSGRTTAGSDGLRRTLPFPMPQVCPIRTGGWGSPMRRSTVPPRRPDASRTFPRITPRNSCPRSSPPCAQVPRPWSPRR
jgi:ribonuclease BN (tRNA processing enzyme)